MILHRREFLAAATMGASALGAGSRIKIGQVGTTHPHAQGKLEAIRKFPELFELVGIVEADDLRWAAIGKRGGYAAVPRISEEQLFNTPGLQAVTVETRVQDLVPTALRCLEAGVHIHLDKPAGESLPACKAMHALAARKQRVIQMGYMLRYHPAFEFLYQVLDKGWLGELTEVSGMMGKYMNDAGRRELSVFAGGGMFELACHLIDQVVTVLGKPTAVTPFTRRSFPEKDSFADNQLAVLEYPKAIATVRCNHIDRMGGPRREFSVTGTDGTLEIRPLESGDVRLGLSRGQGKYKKGYQDLRFPRIGGRYDGEFLDLARVIRGEKELAWNATHDIATHEAVLMACGLGSR
ncbi:MAG: putative dehydrogenase [Rhodothermales bacterium]|jgi:predicted dehydrogenase